LVVERGREGESAAADPDVYTICTHRRARAHTHAHTHMHMHKHTHMRR